MRRLDVNRVRAVGVIIPAHDEEDLLAGCLASVRASLAHPALADLATCIVVVLDACSDGSAEIARRALRRHDEIVVCEERNVGVARAVGTMRALERLGVEPSSVWLAHTDADTTVPPAWIARHVSLATRVDALAGVVRVADWSPHDAETRRSFEQHYRTRPFTRHRHVHGANLAVRGSAYLAVDGFRPLRCSEDHALWDALNNAGHTTLATRRSWVHTSARRIGRANGGFADTLRALGGDETSSPSGSKASGVERGMASDGIP